VLDEAAHGQPVGHRVGFAIHGQLHGGVL
jgi:hypothetical protein